MLFTLVGICYNTHSKLNEWQAIFLVSKKIWQSKPSWEGQEHLTPAYKLYKSTRVKCSLGLDKTQVEKGNNN